jgi:hypothetical protein
MFAMLHVAQRCYLAMSQFCDAAPFQNLTTYVDQLASAIGEYEGTFIGETGSLVRPTCLSHPRCLARISSSSRQCQVVEALHNVCNAANSTEAGVQMPHLVQVSRSSN